MFIGDFEKAAPWSSASIRGCKRFLDRVWNLQTCVTDGAGYRPEIEGEMHKTIKKVTEDIEALKFNTALAAIDVYKRQEPLIESKPTSCQRVFV